MNIFLHIVKNISKTFRHVFFSLFLDFLPILGFIYVAQAGKVYTATSVLMLLTIVTTLITYIREKRLPYITLYVSFITVFFGTATIHHKDVEFIQIRDTLYDISLFLAFAIGALFRISVLKISLHKVFSLSDRGWNIMTAGWSVFFLLSAVCNEYMRRYQNFHDWLSYKEILIPITILTAFTLYGMAIYEDISRELSSRK